MHALANEQTEAPRPCMEKCAPRAVRRPNSSCALHERPSACSDNQIAFAPLVMARLYPGGSPILIGLCCASFHESWEHPTCIGFRNKRHNSSYCGFICQRVGVLMTKNMEKARPDLVSYKKLTYNFQAMIIARVVWRCVFVYHFTVNREQSFRRTRDQEELPNMLEYMASSMSRLICWKWYFWAPQRTNSVANCLIRAPQRIILVGFAPLCWRCIFFVIFSLWTCLFRESDNFYAQFGSPSPPFLYDFSLSFFDIYIYI